MSSRLADYLIDRKLLAPAALEEALKAQAMSGAALDTVLLERRALTEEALLSALAGSSELNSIDLNEFEPNPEVAGLLPAKIAERLGVVPLSLDGNAVHLATRVPVPLKELDEVGVLL